MICRLIVSSNRNLHISMSGILTHPRRSIIGFVPWSRSRSLAQPAAECVTSTPAWLARRLVDRSSGTGIGWRTDGESSQVKITPVFSAQSYADRINFGKVRCVNGRRIEIAVDLPSAEEIAKLKAGH